MATRVLVVDDDAAIRDVLRMALEDTGYEVLEAGDGEKALALLADPDHVAVMLLDWLMPVRDGGGVACGLGELPPQVRRPAVIVVAATDAQQRAASIGADGALGKPFDLAELLAAVARCADAQAQGQGEERSC